MPSPRSNGNAHYTIHVPTHDPHGNQLLDLTSHGIQSLQERIPRMLHDVHAEGPHPTHPYRHLKILAVDSPETDSHIKNLAVELAQMSGHPSIFGHKDGQQGSQPWTLMNQAYTGMPSEHLEPSVGPPAASVAPANYPGYP